MRLREITEAWTTWDKPKDSTFWYDSNTDTLIDCKTFHHTDFILMKPERFGLSEDKIINLKRWKGSYDDLMTYMYDHQMNILDEDIIHAVIANGFVRIVKEDIKSRISLGLQGNINNCRKAVIHFQNNGVFPFKVITQNKVIYGSDIETFIKTGKIISDENGNMFV